MDDQNVANCGAAVVIGLGLAAVAWLLVSPSPGRASAMIRCLRATGRSPAPYPGIAAGKDAALHRRGPRPAACRGAWPPSAIRAIRAACAI